MQKLQAIEVSVFGAGCVLSEFRAFYYCFLSHWAKRKPVGVLQKCKGTIIFFFRRVGINVHDEHQCATSMFSHVAHQCSWCTSMCDMWKNVIMVNRKLLYSCIFLGSFMNVRRARNVANWCLTHVSLVGECVSYNLIEARGLLWSHSPRFKLTQN